MYTATEMNLPEGDVQLCLAAGVAGVVSGERVECGEYRVGAQSRRVPIYVGISRSKSNGL